MPAIQPSSGLRYMSSYCGASRANCECSAEKAGMISSEKPLAGASVQTAGSVSASYQRSSGSPAPAGSAVTNTCSRVVRPPSWPMK